MSTVDIETIYRLQVFRDLREELLSSLKEECLASMDFHPDFVSGSTSLPPISELEFTAEPKTEAYIRSLLKVASTIRNCDRISAFFELLDKGIAELEGEISEVFRDG